MSALRMLGAIVGAFFILAALALVVFFVAPMTYSGLIERIINATTGFEASISTLEADLFPPYLAAGGVQVNNPAANSDEPLLTVEHFSAAADASRWIEGASTWWNAKASGVVLRVTQDENGQGNWRVPSGDVGEDDEKAPRDAPTGAKADHAGLQQLFTFEAIELSNLDIFRVIEGESSQLHIARLWLKKDSDERLNVELDANYQDQPLTASGTLVLPRSDRAREIDFRASLFGNDLRLEGMVGHDGITPGEARFVVQIDDLSTLSRLLDQDLNVFAPIDLNGRLKAPEEGQWALAATGELDGRDVKFASDVKVEGQTYQMRKLSLEYGNSSINANGRLDTDDKTLAVKLSADSIDVNQLRSLTGNDDERPQQSTTGEAGSGSLDMAWLEPWSIDITAKVTELLYAPYQAESLTFALDNEDGAVTASAGFESLTAAAKESESSAGTASGTERAGENNIVNAAEQNKELPSIEASENKAVAWQWVEPLAITATLELADAGKTSGWPVTVKFNSTGMKGKLDAVIPLAADGELKGSMQADVDSFAALRGFSKQRWDTFLPLALRISAQEKQSTLQLKPIELGIRDNTLSGDLLIDRSQTPLQISGDLHADSLDVNQFSTTSAEMLESKGEQIDKESRDVIGDEPIDWSWLQAANTDLSISLDKLTLNQTSFSNVKTQVMLRDAKLAVDPIRADLKKGGVRGHLLVKQEDAGAAIDTRLIVTELSPGDLGKKNSGLIDGGETDVLIELNTSGATPQELAAGLDGEIAAEIQRATIRNNLFEVIGSDIVLQTVNLLNPFAKKDDRTELECAAIYFKAEEGVLTSPEQLVIETAKMKIRGGGKIDLGEETLRIDFVPTPRKGVGISLSSLASVVRLDGTLGKPQPVADPKGVLKAGATIGAAIATGGISLVAQGLFDRVRSVGTACGKIFEQVPEADIPGALTPSGAGDSAG